MKKAMTFMVPTLLLLGAWAARPLEAAATKAVCHVCRVTKGEAEEEPVKAARSYQGSSYGFCSEKCAKAFEADPAAYVPPSFPRSAPRFAVKDLTGNTISNESIAGRVVLLDFWATWCVPCRKTMPELQTLHDKYSRRGLSIVGVSIDEGEPSKVKKFVASRKITYPIAVDSPKNPAWDAFRVKAVPAAYLIDREGRIVAQWTGAPAKLEELEARLDGLLQAD